MPLSLAQGWPVSTLLSTTSRSPASAARTSEQDLSGPRQGCEAAKSDPEMTKLWEAHGPGASARRSRGRSFRSGTTRSASSSPARPAPTSWATGRRASSRWPTWLPAWTTTAFRASASTPMLNTGGDVFFFPKSERPGSDDAQMKMASMMISKPVQVAFNLKKGSCRSVSRRRSRRGQRLHEEGPRDPRGSEQHRAERRRR